jgi:D-alanyl-D-alanine carboxypeptidase
MLPIPRSMEHPTVLLRASLALSLLLTCSAGQAGIAFSSAHVLVVDEASGGVLLSKGGDSAAPIASLTEISVFGGLDQVLDGLVKLC